MNGCYIELPDTVKFPFTTEEFLCEEDLELIAKTEFPEDLTKLKTYFPNSKIRWNSFKLYHDAHTSEPDRFNGMALIHNTQLKHKVREWLHATFNPDFLAKDFYSDFPRMHTPPVTILCYNLVSGWHREGTVDVPHNFPHTTERMDDQRWPAVCNFRLVGDESESKLQFLHLTHNLKQALNKTRREFFKHWYLKENRWDQKAQDWQRIDPTDSITIDGVRMMTHTEYIIDEDRWKDDLNICAEHRKFINPHIVNLGKFHRVETIGKPRVTLRVHANKNLSFNDIEYMYETGTLLR